MNPWQPALQDTAHSREVTIDDKARPSAVWRVEVDCFWSGDNQVAFGAACAAAGRCA